jgi:hypothetical protein
MFPKLKRRPILFALVLPLLVMLALPACNPGKSADSPATPRSSDN